MLQLGDIVRPKEGYVANEYLFKIKSKVYTSVPLCKWQYKIERLTAEPCYEGSILEQINSIRYAENETWDEDELELINDTEHSTIKLNVHKMASNYNKEEKEMKILELYKERRENAILEDYNNKRDKILAEDEIQKIIKEMVHQVNSIFENEEREDRLYIDSKDFYQEKTMDKLDELDELKENEVAELDKTIEEIEALFDLTDDYEERMKILKKYGIIDKDGKVSL